MKYDFTAIEKKWQTRWAEEKTFACQNGDTTKPKFYGLVEFPYPCLLYTSDAADEL